MPDLPGLPNVERVIAIASGKGGVGKTTVSVNLALALRGLGARVGLFDADIFGPNVPLMLGIHRRKAGGGFVPIARAQSAAPYIEPLERYGLRVMSMGFVIAEDQVINPLAEVVGQVVVETLRSVQWGPLDWLLLDLPPSAGQPQQDLLARVRLDGVVIVTTPQDLSLLDASRSLLMYAQAGVPVIGLVENMSYFICSSCGERHEIFQHSGRWLPEALQSAPVLGRVPLAGDISRGIDRTHPLMADFGREAAARPAESAQAAAFIEIARAIHQRLTPLSLRETTAPEAKRSGGGQG
jgi:ATP-binding protein involved in chromosome partitioning